MAAPLNPQPARIPLVDSRGLVTVEWQRFFEALFGRVGGTFGDSTTDLMASAFDDAGTEELEGAIYRLTDEVRALPAPAPAPAEAAPAIIPSELQELRERVAQLERRLEDMQKGQTWL